MEPKLSRVVELRMVEANSRISNFTSLFVRPNETLNVTCLIEAPHETDFVYWYKNKDPIQFDNLKLRRFASKQDSRGQKVNSERKTSPAGVFKSKNTFISAGSSSYKQNNSRANNSSERPNLNAKKSDANRQLTEDELESGPNYSGSNEEQEEREDEEENGSDSDESQDERQAQLLRSSSSLIIKQTQVNDSANYTCLVSSSTLVYSASFVCLSYFLANFDDTSFGRKRTPKLNLDKLELSFCA